MKISSLLVAALSSSCIAAPHAVSIPSSKQAVEKRQLSEIISQIVNGIEALVSPSQFTGLLSALEDAGQILSPSSVEDALSKLESILTQDQPADIFEYTAYLIVNGLLADSVETLVSSLEGEVSAENSENNNNPAPPTTIYPKKSDCDAPYSVSEEDLRSAIYIPPTFTHGQKPPVILFPGTGVHGYEAYSGTFIPLLTDVDWADPVWVNVPDRLLGDAQVNSEYAAYALNYIASVTGRDVAMVVWSQGSINSQWALKYWPSTRESTSNLLIMSGDYKGTALANFICPENLGTCAPSVYQQEYMTNSNFITTLREDGGDSGYVPTTSVYSAFLDEVVEPQSGTNASAYLLDARNVGVRNYELQEVCAGGLGATFYGHEGPLYHPLTIALLKDAMANGGPGEISRLDMESVCSTLIAPGLSLASIETTENAIVIAALGIILGTKSQGEPAIMSYATAASSC